MFYLQNINTNKAERIDIAVIDLRHELALRRRKWVILGELHVEFEDSVFIGRIRWAVYVSIPFEEIFL